MVLYWAEGLKEKDYQPGSPMKFSNSDPDMIKVFLEWLKLNGVKREDIYFDLYIHENNKYRLSKVISYWSKKIGTDGKNFKIYFKKNIIKTKRKKIDSESYFGLIRICVKRSSHLVRKVDGWVKGIVENI